MSVLASGTCYNKSVPATYQRPGTRQPLEVAAMNSVPRLCSADGCENPAKTKGYCGKHYMRLLRHGRAYQPERRTECTVDGCQQKHHSKGMCEKHRKRVLRNDSLEPKLIRGDNEKRFWIKVNKNGPIHPDLGTPCWLWKARINTSGYGYFKSPVGDKAHRYSYTIGKGEIPDGLLVCHKCDNPPCTNPDHLFLGSHQDNMDDMHAKGRARAATTAADSYPAPVDPAVKPMPVEEDREGGDV